LTEFRYTFDPPILITDEIRTEIENKLGACISWYYSIEHDLCHCILFLLKECGDDAEEGWGNIEIFLKKNESKWQT
jgi:hypothetical protein